MQDDEGQIMIAHSVSAGLDYPGTGPQRAWLRDTGKVSYDAIEDRAALEALRTLSRLEGVIPALESSHAIGWVLAHRQGSSLDVVCLSGRGDKDLAEVITLLSG
jgi:tryptophan synthase beta chain